MEKSTVIEILKTFSKEELARFGDFCASPYHNKKSNVTKLYSTLKKQAPDFLPEKVTKENLWKGIFPGKKYNYGIMKNLIHDLTRLAELYLGVSGSFTDTNYEKSLLKQLTNRGLTRLMEKKNIQFEKQLDISPVRDENYLYGMIFILSLKQRLGNNKTLMEKYSTDTSLFGEKLYVLLSCLDILQCHVEINRSSAQHDTNNIDEVLKYLSMREKNFEDFPEAVMYYLLCRARSENNHDLYFSAKDKFFHGYASFTPHQKNMIFTNLLNYCVDKANEKKFADEYFRVYVKMTEDPGFPFRENQKITSYSFRNTIHASAHLGELKYLESYITRFLDIVDAPRDSMKKYAYAMLFYNKGEYDKALEMCSRVDYNDFFESVKDNYFFKNDIRMVMLKSCYELGLYENVLSAIDSHKRYLKNLYIANETSRRDKVVFLGYMKRFIKLLEDGQPGAMEIFKNEITSAPEFFHQNWLIKKTGEKMHKLP